MNTENTNHVSCLIIGSGPSGYTAAIYAARADLKPLVITGIEQGGQLMTTTEVENYPGYPNGRTGPEMMEDFRLQAERFQTRIVYEHVTEVDLKANPKVVKTDSGKSFTADSIIISTGASANWLGLPNEQKLRLSGGGVSACAVCDGFFYKGLDVAVVGGGDSAAEEASYLAKLCKSVHLLVRKEEMRASKIMVQRVMNMPNLTIHWNTETIDVVGDEKVEGVKVMNTKTKTESIIPVQGFFLAIGHKPNTDIFKGQLELDANGYIVTKGKTTKTSIPGVFASGDVQDHEYRQAVTAAGSGCMAALDAERWLKAEGLS